MGSFASFVVRQYYRVPYPTQSFANKTVIVTGSNVGLGKEAARHIARLGASTVILAVRNVEKGEEAKRDIEQSTGCGKDVVKVWQLDLCSYQSVQDFAARAEKDLSRIDVLLENAGLARDYFSMAEDNESQITINVVSTFLLAFLLLPKLKETAQKFNTRPVLTIVSSEMHKYTKLPERSAPEGQIFDTLNDKDKADMKNRYSVSKLLEVFAVRELAEKAPADRLPVTVNAMNPGLCHSELAREAGWMLWFVKLLFAHSTEVGSRSLVHATAQGPETHGAYLSECRVAKPGPFVLTEEGKKTQKRVWNELIRKLETIRPGVTNCL